jgi:phosphatidylserine/phosphatidylglycerophosphate/cardiolipin synthase-like enzyme
MRKKYKLLFYLILILIYILMNLYLFIPKGTIDDVGSIDLFMCKKTNCSFLLTTLIEKSNDVKCAFYDLGEPAVLKSLNQNKVETLLFEDNYQKNSNYSFLEVGSDGLMHHKFCIFDEKIVLTGSWNPTTKETYLNDNYVLIIVSEKISDAYLDEFNKVKTGKTNSGNYKFNLSGTKVDLCFSPQGNCEKLFIENILEAKKEIKFLAFTFTSKPIADAMLSSNISISGIMEKTRISQYSVNKLLPNVTLDNNKYTMHEKAFIIDDDKVILGSYNPTNGANTINDENVLVIESTKFNQMMREEFDRILMY